MAYFRYEDDEERSYFSFGDLKRGDLVTASELPDHRFVQLSDEEVQLVTSTQSEEQGQ